MPYHSYENFKHRLDEEQRLFLFELNKEAIKINDSIQNILNIVNDLRKEFDTKVTNIEDELMKTNFIYDKIFEKLYDDINNINSYNLSLLNNSELIRIVIRLTVRF